MKILKRICVIISIIVFLINIINFKKMYAINSEDEEKDIILVIDPGHGGSMSGAINEQLGIMERDVTLKIARYLRDFLNEYEGIKVIMTHDGLPDNYELELPARGMVARNNNADMMISLHINASEGKNSREGAEVYVTANKLLPKYNEESTKFGNIVLDELSKLGIKNRGVMTRLCGDTGPKWEYSDGSVADYYAVIRYPMKGDGEDRGVDLANGEGIPGVLIEHCYIRGQDAQYLDSEEDIKNLARADCNAIVKYYSLEKKDPARVSKINLDKQNIELITEDELQLNATILPDTAVNKNITWQSSNEKVATVNENGKIIAISEGEATITAITEDRNKKAKCIVKVKEPLKIDKKEWNLVAGNKLKIYPQIETKNKELEWKSSNEQIATVEQNGIITAVSEGNAIITITNIERQKSKNVVINVHELSKDKTIDTSNFNQNYEILSKIGEKIPLADLKNKMILSSDLELTAYNKDGNLIKNNEFITTNTKLQIKNDATVLQEYLALIYGDVNEDGKISALDYALIKNDIMDVQKIETQIQKIASDINGDGKISALDYALIKNHIMEVQFLDVK